MGSGGGGISHLMHSANCTVINIEPSSSSRKMKNRENWRTYKSIEEFLCHEEKTIIDFFYSSHSLEHVHNIDYYLELFENLIVISFFEVPNCRVSQISRNFFGVEEVVMEKLSYHTLIISHQIFFQNNFDIDRIAFVKNGAFVSSENMADGIISIGRLK